MSETIINLTKAFVGESQARNRYTFYAKVAKKEGYELIASIFELTANQEREHASWLFKLINELKLKENIAENVINIETESPNVYGTTIENLKTAMAGENYEHTDMYPTFAKKAIEEGYKEIGVRLIAIAKAEENHEYRFGQLLKRLEDGSIFKSPEPIIWVCRECGHIHLGITPPEECPSCGHDKAFFERRIEY